MAKPLAPPLCGRESDARACTAKAQHRNGEAPQQDLRLLDSVVRWRRNEAEKTHMPSIPMSRMVYSLSNHDNKCGRRMD